MTVQLLGWAAFLIGLAGTWLLPKTRHGWLLAIACGVTWGAVDVLLGLWPGLASAAIASVANWRCWQHHVTGNAPSRNRGQDLSHF